MVEKKYEIKKAFSCSDEMCSLTQELNKKRIGPEINNRNQITRKASKTIIQTKQENLKLKRAIVMKEDREKITCYAEDDEEILDQLAEIGKVCDNIVIITSGNLKNSQRINEYDAFASNVWGKYYGVIYKITDNDNGKVYIGQTIQPLRDRFRDHLKSPANQYLARAINRYNRSFRIIKNGIKNGAMSYRTQYSEFSIEIIAYASDFFELNKLEKQYIKAYKSHIPTYGEKYGYNVQEGGDALTHKSGEDHWRWIIIDEDLLIKYIKKGFLVKEIAAEFGVSIATIERRIRELKDKYNVKNITEARRLFGGSKESTRRRAIISRLTHPKVKEIDDDEFLNQIRILKTRREIQEYFDIGHVQFYDKLNELGYEGLDQAREDLGVLDAFKEKKAIKFRKGYSDVSDDELIRAIRAGLTKDELKIRYKMGDIQFYQKLKGIGYDSLLTARKDLGGQKNFQFRQFIRYNKYLLKRIYPLINKPFIKVKDISNLVGISDKGAFHHISNSLIPYNIIERLHKRGYYRFTKFGKEFLSKFFKNELPNIKIGGIRLYNP
ncbi:MAG: GIY-YIG nuclease family protein [Promethearchaeota archaeon]